MSAPSARGLFRATGKAAAPISVTIGEDLAGAFSRDDFAAREADDFYPTPPEPLRAFLSAERGRLAALGGPVWEPAAGNGVMAAELSLAGFDVCASDLVDRGCGAVIASFYDHAAPPQGVRCAVTNPPFAECNTGRWIDHAMGALGLDYMALLLPLGWPGAASRAQLLARYRLARIYLMAWRIDFTGAGAPPMLNAWFVWDKGHGGPAEFHILQKGDDWRQGCMLSTRPQARKQETAPPQARKQETAPQAGIEAA